MEDITKKGIMSDAYLSKKKLLKGKVRIKDFRKKLKRKGLIKDV